MRGMGVQQPQGVAARRVIADKVKTNLRAYAPRCCEAECYLLAWARGTLPQQPRPLAYSFLTHRQSDINDSLNGLSALPWEIPGKKKYQVALADDSESDGDELEIDLQLL